MKLAWMAAIALAATALAGSSIPQERASRPGEYRGYAQASYDGVERTSFYIPMRDGTRLAVDLFRPTAKGKVETGPLPVVWMHTPYNRRTYRGRPTAEAYPGHAVRLVPYGYVVAVVDFRGLFASFGGNKGFNRGEWMEPASTDAYDITEWFAKQPWSNGNVGMWGCSATGGSQMQAATTAPPHLKAIFPMSCEFDVYPFGVSGGMARGVDTGPPPGAVVNRDTGAAAVDGPDGAAQLSQAVAGHKDNIDTAGPVPFRDSRSTTLGVPWWVKSSPHTSLDKLKASKIAIYAAANWDEASTRYGAFFTFKNLSPQTKLIVGPGGHCDWDLAQRETGFDIVVEELRFFDYWLKGVKNGVMDEPRVTYFTYNAPAGKTWQQARDWPLPNQRPTDYHLGGGALALKAAAAGSAETLTGDQPNISSIDIRPQAGGLAFDTAVLDRDVQITGHPVLRLWIATDLKDADLTAILEDVAPDGATVTHNMVGLLRASRRAEAKPPYDNLGLPWHSHLEKDARPLVAGQPTELAVDLLPMSYVFKAGHRIRLRVAFSDPAGGKGAKVQVLSGPKTPSRITLPMIPAS